MVRQALPPAVVALALACGADGQGLGAVLLTQTGEMRTDASQPWRSFRARQSIALDQPAFEWRASTGPLGCIVVTDALKQSGPQLSVTAFGVLPLARPAADAALTKGELQRYLAELPLAPDAILRNASLQWEVVDPTTLRVGATHAGVWAQVELKVGQDGLVASAFAPDRPRLEGAVSVERPWTGRFSDYRTQEGRRIPFSAHVAWTLDGQEVTYWRGRMTSWKLRAAG